MDYKITKSVGGKPPSDDKPKENSSAAGSAGFSAPNIPEDVKQIQALINKLHITSQELKVDGVCTIDLVNAISLFQSLWGTSDGRVDPSGATLKRLNATINPLVINPISLPEEEGVEIKYYSIGYDKDFSNYHILKNSSSKSLFKLYLYISKEVSGDPQTDVLLNQEISDYCLEVTSKPRKNLLKKDDLPVFFDIIDKLKIWASRVALRLIVVNNGYIISVSTKVIANTPVQPWSGQLTPSAIYAGDDGPKIIYYGTGKKPFKGRYLYKIGQKYFFRYGPHLSIKNEKRGFDCISFVGSLFEIKPIDGTTNPYYDSNQMANSLKATAVEWESGEDKISSGKAKGSIIKKFFESTMGSGSFLLWSGGHIVIVVNKEVFEFSPNDGAKKTSIDKHKFITDNKDLNLYKLPADKQF